MSEEVIEARKLVALQAAKALGLDEIQMAIETPVETTESQAIEMATKTETAAAVAATVATAINVGQSADRDEIARAGQQIVADSAGMFEQQAEEHAEKIAKANAPTEKPELGTGIQMSHSDAAKTSDPAAIAKAALSVAGGAAVEEAADEELVQTYSEDEAETEAEAVLEMDDLVVTVSADEDTAVQASVAEPVEETADSMTALASAGEEMISQVSSAVDDTVQASSEAVTETAENVASQVAEGVSQAKETVVQTTESVRDQVAEAPKKKRGFFAWLFGGK